MFRGTNKVIYGEFKIWKSIIKTTLNLLMNLITMAPFIQSYKVKINSVIYSINNLNLIETDMTDLAFIQKSSLN